MPWRWGSCPRKSSPPANTVTETSSDYRSRVGRPKPSKAFRRSFFPRPKSTGGDEERASAETSQTALGAIFGGGKDAAIGALAGGAGGAGAQVYTGRKKPLPAETELKFKLAEDLQMRAVSGTSTHSLKKRTNS